jgi:hypothetical protein
MKSGNQRRNRKIKNLNEEMRGGISRLKNEMRK